MSAVCAVLVGCQSGEEANNTIDQTQVQASTPSGSSLKVASWNIEHLAYPAEAGCRPRTAQEMSEMKQYAATVNADIVAMQEVHSAQAVHQLFPASDWQVVMSGRPDNDPFDCRSNGNKSTQQKVAFAVRKGIELKETNSLSEFALDSRGLRHALEITVDGEFGPMSLLNVHMKSGCFVDDYSSSDKYACQTYAKQAPILDAYVESKEKAATPYVILGDFNHRLATPNNFFTSELMNNTDGSASTLKNATATLKGCHEYYPVPIDHILVGNLDDNQFLMTPNVYHYKNMEPKLMLSDHCAVTLTLTTN